LTIVANLGKLIRLSGSAPAEATDRPPVASGADSTPSTWFELAIDLCASGHISHDRCVRAIEAVREAVARV
jgi:hypothetical protein